MIERRSKVLKRGREVNNQDNMNQKSNIISIKMLEQKTDEK